MVQLKEHGKQLKSIGKEIFQFQYGTIKRLLMLTLEKEMLKNFNSNMVQLKEQGLQWFLLCVVFQFQYGTIKSANKFFNYYAVNNISIPIWYN